MNKKWMSLPALALTLALTACMGPGASSSAIGSVPASITPVPISSDAPHNSVDPSVPTERPVLRIAGLKGPTTMGMVKLMQDSAAGTTAGDYRVEMFGTADEIVAKIGNGQLDMAAVPCNLASVLYNKTKGGIQVAAVNTLGVLYVVETGDTVHSVADLKGKTVYATGKGTTPEYALQYILRQNGLDPEKDLTIEFKSEATEVAARLAQGESGIAMLPQPYVATVAAKNDKLRVALDLTKEWDAVSDGKSSLVTGVLIVRTDFLKQNKAAFDAFLDDYRASTEFVNANPEEAAKLVAAAGIVPAEGIAKAAIPLCNITYLEGAEMQTRVDGYLSVLFGQNPASVGGTLPDEQFYYKR